jgi:hypothetical protein
MLQLQYCSTACRICTTQPVQVRGGIECNQDTLQWQPPQYEGQLHNMCRLLQHHRSGTCLYTQVCWQWQLQYTDLKSDADSQEPSGLGL